MKNLKVVFRIVKEKNCPLYKEDERLHLSDKTLSCPLGKEMCLILVRDLTELLFKFLGEQSSDLAEYTDTVFNCSGCSGLIKFALLQEDESEIDAFVTDSDGGAIAQIDPAALKGYEKTVECSLMQVLPPDLRENIFCHFREIFLEEGTVVIRKGERNLNLYIVCEGELLVESGGVHLATLVEGEVFGEMSYLGADVAVSTVRAIKNSKVLAIGGDVFGDLLGDNREVQSYMAQLLSDRLGKTNAARARDFESCMSGRIDEIVPAELFQIFHMHQKTGVLSLELPGGKGKVAFREGCIINASYCEHANQEAIFKILAEKKGFYRFTSGLSPSEMRAAEIGDFMMLLMEGVKRVDEEHDRS